MGKVTRSELVKVLLVTVILPLVLFQVNLLDGGIASPAAIDASFAMRANDVTAWGLHDIVPQMRSHILFKFVLDGVYDMAFPLDDKATYWAVYYLYSLFFYILTHIVLYRFLRIMEFDAHEATVGVAVFAILPAVLFAYAAPVFTQSDFLGYTIVLLGLIATIRGYDPLVLLLVVLGQFTRETTAIIVLFYATWHFLGDGQRAPRRVLLWLASYGLTTVALYVGIRVHIGTAETFNQDYTFVQDLLFNFDNIMESLGFNFMVFGPLWMFIFTLGAGPRGRAASALQGRFLRTVPLCVCAIALTLLIARAREMRLMNLAFPWLVVCVLLAYRCHADMLAKYWQEHRILVLSVAAAAGLGFLTSVAMGHLDLPGVNASEITLIESFLWRSLLIVELAACLLLWFVWRYGRQTAPSSAS